MPSLNYSLTVSELINRIPKATAETIAARTLTLQHNKGAVHSSKFSIYQMLAEAGGGLIFLISLLQNSLISPAIFVLWTM